VKPKIKIKKGSIGYPVYRVSVQTDRGEKKEFGAEYVQVGFGITERDAVRDFITKNKANLIEHLYEAEEDSL